MCTIIKEVFARFNGAIFHFSVAVIYAYNFSITCTFDGTIAQSASQDVKQLNCGLPTSITHRKLLTFGSVY